MPQRLPLGGFKWVEEASQFNEDFMQSYNVIHIRNLKQVLNVD